MDGARQRACVMLGHGAKALCVKEGEAAVVPQWGLTHHVDASQTRAWVNANPEGHALDLSNLTKTMRLSGEIA